jgi:hypothetical protein
MMRMMPKGGGGGAGGGGGGVGGRPGFDEEEEKRKMRLDVVSKVASFAFFVGLIKATPWLLEKTHLLD